MRTPNLIGREAITTLYAQPYEISAIGFYFESLEEYQEKALNVTNDFGQTVEEFEIQFIDGETIDAELARAIGLNQSNFGSFLNHCAELDDHDKSTLIVAIGECGYLYEPRLTAPQEFDVNLYEVKSLRYLAEYFVDEGLMGVIPDSLLRYFDYDALAREPACDFVETTMVARPMSTLVVRLEYRLAEVPCST